MEYNLYISAKKEVTNKLNSLFNKYIEQGLDLNTLKTWILSKTNLNKIILDINRVAYEYFESNSEYEEFIKQIIFEVVDDMYAEQKDKLNNMENKKEIKNENFKILEGIKDFQNFFNKFEILNEMNVPVIKIDELIHSVPQTKPAHKYILSARYKVPQDYIDLVSKLKHHFKINDMRGDILGNSRVIFDVYVYNDEDINRITENIIDYCVNDFISQLPENLNIFGINIAPMSFIDKEELTKSFKLIITFDETVKIIGKILDMDFDIKYDNYYIWSNKNKIGKTNI